MKDEEMAEEYADKNKTRGGSSSFGDITNYHDLRQGFIAGAEFGYNKALEEIGDLRDCCNCKHWKYSTRSLSYYCDKTSRVDDCQLQYYRCEHWER